MKTTKHTPAPWYVRNPACDSLSVVHNGGTFHEWPRNYSTRDLADAHLISAAPELLAALKAIVKGWESVDPNEQVPDQINVNEFWENAKAAISKAERQ